MSKELFERDLEQAKTLFDLRAVLGTVNECSLKNPVWSRRVHDLISHFGGIDLFLPTWEEQVRTVLGEIRTLLRDLKSRDELYTK